MLRILSLRFPCRPGCGSSPCLRNLRFVEGRRSTWHNGNIPLESVATVVSVHNRRRSRSLQPSVTAMLNLPEATAEGTGCNQLRQAGYRCSSRAARATERLSAAGKCA